MTRHTDERTLSPFEKNRFFRGKLMTPRDMTVEQEYHADRLHALSRSVLDSGVVAGLSVASVAERDDDIEVAVEPGLAIDGYGRPVQVDRRTTKTLPAPEADCISLYVRYSERPVESAPVPDAADGDDAVNRAVETAEITYRTGPPPEDDTDGGLSLDGLRAEDPATVMRTLTERHHDRNRSDPEPPADPAVFVDAFERTNDGWQRRDHGVRTHAADHELLLRALAQHLADEERHGGTATGSADDQRSERLDRLEERVADLEHERAVFADYAVRRTLGDRKRRFRDLADRVEPQSGGASRLARTVATADDDRIEDLVADEAALRDALSELCPSLSDLADSLEGICTADSVEGYREAVSALEGALEQDASVLGVVRAHDRVCERADDLSVLVSVRPE